jgi:hypothetical protein
VIATVGATFLTVTERLPVAEPPVESVTFTVTVNEPSLVYLCAAEIVPGEPLNVDVVPSPHVTVTVYGPTPPEKEPRLNVVFAPSLTLAFEPAVSASGGGATTVIDVLTLVEAPLESVTLKVIVKEPAVAYEWLL